MGVKGLDKVTSIRLAEVLSQKNLIATDAITDALYTQDQLDEPFAEALVSGGHITEWDLAKLVVEHFQLPFIMASNHEVDADVKSALPMELLFKNHLIPLDKFGDVILVAMPILTPNEVFDDIQKNHKLEVFPYVGLISENKKVLSDMFPDFQVWLTKQAEIKERRRRAKTSAGPSNWMNVFDTADAKVRDALKT